MARGEERERSALAKYLAAFGVKREKKNVWRAMETHQRLRRNRLVYGVKVARRRHEEEEAWRVASTHRSAVCASHIARSLGRISAAGERRAKMSKGGGSRSRARLISHDINGGIINLALAASAAK
jgi:hypothetical protein